MTPSREIAPAKLNLALHVRGRLPDGRHAIETLFAFCIDGDRLEGEFLPGDPTDLSLEVAGPFGSEIEGINLIERAWDALRATSGTAGNGRTMLRLVKNLPVASGLGGGSADAAAALRLLTALWNIDPGHALAVAPEIGSDVPACLLSLPARGEGAGDRVAAVSLPELANAAVLLINPRVPLSTAEVFARWDGLDRGPLGDWREGRNDLEAAAIGLVPQIETILAWLAAQPGADLVRMSGSGATCFALFADAAARDHAAAAVPREWWHLATSLR